MFLPMALPPPCKILGGGHFGVSVVLDIGDSGTSPELADKLLLWDPGLIPVKYSVLGLLLLLEKSVGPCPREPPYGEPEG